MGVAERWKGKPAIIGSRREIVASAVCELRKDHRVAAAYVFGSAAREEGGTPQDLDLAIFTEPSFGYENLHELNGTITHALRSDRVDIVWMNKADPILNFEIIKTGRLLFHRGAERLNDFELKAKKAYYDYVLYLEKRRRRRARHGV